MNFLFFPLNFLCRYCSVLPVYDVFGVYDFVFDVMLRMFAVFAMMN